MKRPRKVHKEESKTLGEKCLLAFALLIIAVLVVITAKDMFYTGGASPTALPPDGAISSSVDDVRMVDGVQEVTLSWGKLNYVPEVIRVKADMPVRIRGDMERLSGCFASLTIPDLGVTAYFTEQNGAVEFTPTKKGTFPFGCTMSMGSGTIIVE